MTIKPKIKQTKFSPTPAMKPRYFIGIDPGVQTGVAIWDREARNFISIQTMDLPAAMATITEKQKEYNGDMMVVLEDARKRKFDAGLTEEKKQGAGSIKRDCSIWEMFLLKSRIYHKLTAPNSKLNKFADNVELWQKNTGVTYRTSTHARDASMLVWQI